MSVLLSLSGLVDVLSVCVLFLGLMCAGASGLLFISCQVTTEAPCLCPSRQVAFGFFCLFMLPSTWGGVPFRVWCEGQGHVPGNVYKYSQFKADKLGASI